MIRRRSAVSTLLATLTGILILASGCADQTPTETSLRPAKAILAAKAYQPGVYSASIGTEGGTLDFAGIGAITFPAGALSETTTIQARVDGRTVSVDFQPHGLVFPAGAEPTLSFSVKGLRVETDRLVVYYLGAGGTAQERYEINVNPTLATASTKLHHFSAYALAAE